MSSTKTRVQRNNMCAIIVRFSLGNLNITDVYTDGFQCVLVFIPLDQYWSDDPRGNNITHCLRGIVYCTRGTLLSRRRPTPGEWIQLDTVPSSTVVIKTNINHLLYTCIFVRKPISFNTTVTAYYYTHTYTRVYIYCYITYARTEF